MHTTPSDKLQKLEALTADQLLSIPGTEPEWLYTGDTDALRHEYHCLAKIWYPERNTRPRAEEVFRHITELHDCAEKKIAAHTWQEPGFFICRLKNGSTFRVRADASHAFELGTMHISPTTVTYVVKKDNADLFANAVDVIKKLSFADAKIKDVYASCLPTTFKTYEAEDSLILTVRKSKDHILLRDLMPLIPKKDLGRHVAWITSRLHEMGRYLDYTGIVHNAITLDNVFISPADHTIALLGGWWYATPSDKPLKAIPAAAQEFLSDQAFTTHIPEPKTDLEMIRACGRELLGDRGGTRLGALKSAPKPMLDGLCLPSTGNAQQDLEHWYQQVLPKSFGARRFTKLPVTYSDVYQPKGV